MGNLVFSLYTDSFLLELVRISEMINCTPFELLEVSFIFVSFVFFIFGCLFDVFLNSIFDKFLMLLSWLRSHRKRAAD